MHPSIKHLIELQIIDLRLNELRALLAGLPRRLVEVEARVAAARQQLTAAKESLTTSLKDRKRYEWTSSNGKKRRANTRTRSTR